MCDRKWRAQGHPLSYMAEGQFEPGSPCSIQCSNHYCTLSVVGNPKGEMFLQRIWKRHLNHVFSSSFIKDKEKWICLGLLILHMDPGSCLLMDQGTKIPLTSWVDCFRIALKDRMCHTLDTCMKWPGVLGFKWCHLSAEVGPCGFWNPPNITLGRVCSSLAEQMLWMWEVPAFLT